MFSGSEAACGMGAQFEMDIVWYNGRGNYVGIRVIYPFFRVLIPALLLRLTLSKSPKNLNAVTNRFHRRIDGASRPDQLEVGWQGLIGLAAAYRFIRYEAQIAL